MGSRGSHHSSAAYLVSYPETQLATVSFPTGVGDLVSLYTVFPSFSQTPDWYTVLAEHMLGFSHLSFTPSLIPP